MKATIWHNPKCGTSRKTLAILQDEPDVQLTVVEYLKTPYERDRLERLLREASLTAREALRVRGSRAEELGLTDESIDDNAILDAMAADPMLVNRPLVETEKGVRLCRPQETVREIL